MTERGDPGVRAGRPAVQWIERYWRGEAGRWGPVLDGVLAPIALVYRTVVHARATGYDTGRIPVARAPVPVVSVGNLTVGGAGKTPVTRWLVAALRRRGAIPAILHGGYAEDEPVLHRAWFPDLPVVVGRDRAAGAQAAVAAGATVLVLDDGFQHRRLVRDLDLVLIAAETWSREPRLLPRGPWREPPAALGRAGVVAVTRKAASEDTARRVAEEASRFAPTAAAVRLHLRPIGFRRLGAPSSGGRPRGPVLAVTAIAQPDLFVANVLEQGVEVGDALFFPDHHAYGLRDVAEIQRIARGRPVATTAKDAVKLAPLAAGLEVWILEQEVVVEEGAVLLNALLDALTE